MIFAFSEYIREVVVPQTENHGKMAANANSRGGGIQRVLQKLNKSIEEGSYYEAHQMIRTLYFRFVGAEVIILVIIRRLFLNLEQQV